jgi:hypothetical protein
MARDPSLMTCCPNGTAGAPVPGRDGNSDRTPRVGADGGDPPSAGCWAATRQRRNSNSLARRLSMDGVIYLVGLIVVVMAVLSLLGLR